MVWKQDLAKLKQQLGPEAPAPKPAPKPVPKPDKPASMAEEDAVFLSAMGLRPAPAKPARPELAPTVTPAPTLPSAQTPVEPPAEPPAPETFEDALKDLKGLKPLAKALPGTTAAKPKAPAPPPVSRVQPEAAPSVPAPMLPAVPQAVAPEPEPAAAQALPARFQLAAGMAIEVDGTLDLRGHSLSDALERLKDRLGDGQVLGWRSLLVTLGPDPVLHEGLLNLLASGEAPVARYAQAPVPMGGTQAWLLYLGPTPAQS
jgi:hypothetical protein